MRALSGLFLALLAVPCSFAVDASALLGTWKYETSALIGKGTMYTVFAEGGTCSQVAKVSLVGTTHWVTDRCSWRVDQSTLSMKVVGSVTTPKQIGTSNSVILDSVSTETLAVSKDGKTQQWTRVTGLPGEYEAHLLQEAAAAKP